MRAGRASVAGGSIFEFPSGTKKEWKQFRIERKHALCCSPDSVAKEPGRPLRVNTFGKNQILPLVLLSFLHLSFLPKLHAGSTPSPTPTPNPGVNGKIAFSSKRGGTGHSSIYVMDPDGSNVVRLTDDLGYDYEPAWSPDGTKIAFSSYRSDKGNYEILVMKPDGSGLTNLTNHPALDAQPTWSPDGTKIAFATTRGVPYENWDIYVMNADGSNQTRLTNNPTFDLEPAWSPDGTKIAFATDRDAGDQDYEVYVMDSAGGNEVRLTYDFFGSDVGPAWSPDGARIAFARNRSGTGIFVMNADGSNPIRLTTISNGASHPSWSPDGTRIVSRSLAIGGPGELTVIEANGANPTNLTNNPAEDGDPSWQRTPSFPSVPDQALNISTRMRVETGNNVLIGGFIISGTAPKTVALRAIGPSLALFGISDFLADPTLELRDSSGAVVMQNDNWQNNSAQAAQLIDLGLALQNPKESGMVASLSPDAYTAILAGKTQGTGTGLVEVYDTTSAPGSQLANISTRGFVRTGENVMIGGFILGGNNSPTRVVVRGIGPSLTQFGLNPSLADPTLELRDSNGAILVTNDNWQDDPVSAGQLSANGFALSDPNESGIFTSLPAGQFTAILAGKNGGIGIGLVEIYNLR
jgi:Tol biopolymer transport system component